MAGGGKDANASQFYITTGAALDSLDGKHTLFGEVRFLLAVRSIPMVWRADQLPKSRKTSMSYCMPRWQSVQRMQQAAARHLNKHPLRQSLLQHDCAVHTSDAVSHRRRCTIGPS